MEDALVPKSGLQNGITKGVLILVLMEDALVPVSIKLSEKAKTSLNPCFNGRCTSTA